MPGAQPFGDRPGLGGAAARYERGITVEDFADGAQTRFGQVIEHRQQERAGCFGVAKRAVMREREGAEQPTPDGALVIGAVTAAHVAAV